MRGPRLLAGISHVDSAPTAAAGSPLVLIHGAGGTLRDWPLEIRTLPGRRVIALDLPGHGGSPGPDLGSVPAYARSVLGLLDALGLASAAVAGHSMGGAVALTLALEAPARVDSLVLVATGARLRVAPGILRATADPAALAQAADSMADWAFGSLASPALRREIAEGRKAEAAALHGDFQACDAFDVMARLGSVRAPALVIGGSEDQLTPLKYAAYLRDHISGARLEVVPGAGHMVMLEAPGGVAAAMAAFLASPEARASG